MNRRCDDRSRDGEGQTNTEISVKKSAEGRVFAEQDKQVIAEHGRRQHERQRDNGINDIASRKTLSRQQPGQRRASDERNQRRRARHREREFDRKPVQRIHHEDTKTQINMS